MRIAFITSVSAIIIAVLFWTRPDTHAELRELPPPTVAVENVGLLNIQPITRVTGKLQPARKASLRFQVSGQINERLVEPGQYVELNSVLMRIEDGDFIDAVAESRALLKTEENAIERDLKLLELMQQERILQEREVKRLERLGRRSLSSESNYDQALQVLYRQRAEEARLKHSVDSARSRLVIEQAELNKAERSLSRTQLVSPFAGIVNSVYVEVGDYVSPGEAALEIVQIDELDINLEVTGATASQLKLGQLVNVETNRGVRQGAILALAVDPDPQTNTHSLKIRIPSENLFAGQLAVAHLPGQYYENVHVVPVSAVLYEDGQSFVFELNEAYLIRKPIQLIERYNDFHIIEGVDSGAIIVSRDVSGLADGQLVTTH